jgi:hypothetical protein
VGSRWRRHVQGRHLRGVNCCFVFNFVSLHLQIQQAVQAQLKGLTFGELDQRVLSSAPGKERPQPYTHVLDFHARQAIKHATAQGWNAVKSLPMAQSEEAVTPGWVYRIARWKQSLGTDTLQVQYLHTTAADQQAVRVAMTWPKLQGAMPKAEMHQLSICMFAFNLLRKSPTAAGTSTKPN